MAINSLPRKFSINKDTFFDNEVSLWQLRYEGGLIREFKSWTDTIQYLSENYHYILTHFKNAIRRIN